MPVSPPPPLLPDPACQPACGCRVPHLHRIAFELLVPSRTCSFRHFCLLTFEPEISPEGESPNQTRCSHSWDMRCARAGKPERGFCTGARASGLTEVLLRPSDLTYAACSVSVRWLVTIISHYTCIPVGKIVSIQYWMYFFCPIPEAAYYSQNQGLYARAHTHTNTHTHIHTHTTLHTQLEHLHLLFKAKMPPDVNICLFKNVKRSRHDYFIGLT